MSRLDWQFSKYNSTILFAERLWSDNPDFAHLSIRLVGSNDEHYICYEYNIKMSVDRLEEMKYYIEYIHLADLQVKYEQLKLILGERNE